LQKEIFEFRFLSSENPEFRADSGQQEKSGEYSGFRNQDAGFYI
jgi:hypothetical protein